MELSKNIIKEIAIGLGMIGIGLWIVYRPDLKLKQAFNWIFNIGEKGPYQFNRKEVGKKWEKIESVLESNNLSTWEQTASQALQFFDWVLSLTEPTMETREGRIEKLKNQYRELINAQDGINVLEIVLQKRLEQVQFYEIKNALKLLRNSLRELGAI